MKRLVECVLFVAVVCTAVVWVGSSADAIPPFKKTWDKMYMKEGSAIHKAYGGKSSCNVCHVGKNRKKRNAYGMALSKLLDRKNDAKDVKKQMEAMKKVAKMHTDPKDKKSPTFGELIESGKWEQTKKDEK